MAILLIIGCLWLIANIKEQKKSDCSITVKQTQATPDSSYFSGKAPHSPNFKDEKKPRHTQLVPDSSNFTGDALRLSNLDDKEKKPSYANFPVKKTKSTSPDLGSSSCSNSIPLSSQLQTSLPSYDLNDNSLLDINAGKSKYFENGRITLFPNDYFDFEEDYLLDETVTISYNTKVIENPGKVKHLIIKDVNLDSQNFIDFSSLTSLESLFLERVIISNTSFLKSFNLKKIQLFRCEFGQDFIDMLSLSKNLMSINFQKILPYIFLNIDLSNLSRLVYLTDLALVDCHLNAMHLKQICECKKLRYLNLEENPWLSYADCTNYKIVEINFNSGQNFNYLDQHTRHKNLYLYRIKSFKDWFTNLSNTVKKLNLKNTSLNEVIVEEISKSFTSLRELNLLGSAIDYTFIYFTNLRDTIEVLLIEISGGMLFKGFYSFTRLKYFSLKSRHSLNKEYSFFEFFTYKNIQNSLEFLNLNNIKLASGLFNKYFSTLKNLKILIMNNFSIDVDEKVPILFSESIVGLSIHSPVENSTGYLLEGLNMCKSLRLLELAIPGLESHLNLRNYRFPANLSHLDIIVDEGNFDKFCKTIECCENLQYLKYFDIIKQPKVDELPSISKTSITLLYDNFGNQSSGSSHSSRLILKNKFCKPIELTKETIDWDEEFLKILNS